MSRFHKSSPKVTVLAGFGLNGEDELERAFALAGGAPQRVLVTDFIAEAEAILAGTAIFALPGGFSFGDDTGGGNGLAQLLAAEARPALVDFVASGGLVLGICNGCQALVRMGLVGSSQFLRVEDGQSRNTKNQSTKNQSTEIQSTESSKPTDRTIAKAAKPPLAVVENASGRYEARFVRLVSPSRSAAGFWFAGADSYHLSVAHGEGRFTAPSLQAAQTLFDAGLVALQYSDSSGTPAGGVHPANPNGSLLDIAAVSDASGQVLAMMPHPERALASALRPDWHRMAELARRQGEEPSATTTAGFIFDNAIRRAREVFSV